MVIARAGKPIAELRPIGHVGLVFGGFDVELADDFFAPMPDDELAAWEGGSAAANR